MPGDDAKGIEAAPKSTIRNRYDRRNSAVDDIKEELIKQGCRVSEREILFGDACRNGVCRPDIVARAPDGGIEIIEIKTESADLGVRKKYFLKSKMENQFLGEEW